MSSFHLSVGNEGTTRKPPNCEPVVLTSSALALFINGAVRK